MLAVLLSWIIASFVFFSFGRGGIVLFDKLIGKESGYSFVDTLLLGMCFTATIIAVCSLVIPANIYLLIALFVVSGLYWVLNKNDLIGSFDRIKICFASINKWQFILLVSPAILFLIHSVTAPLWVDTPYYHIQNIMWNEQYHVVPGLANLQPRFGFNSNYYLLCSVFGLRPLLGQYIFGVHQLCIVAIFTWIIFRSIKGLSFAKTVVSIFIITAFIAVYKLHITSPSSDLLPNLLIVYLFIKIIIDGDKALFKLPLLFVCIPAFCLTLKLSAFVVGIFTIVVFYNCIKNKQYKMLLFLVSLAFIIIAPWSIRTIIITGYLIYPYPAIDIFSFDWKVPVEYVQDQKDYILAFARIDGSPIEEVLSLPFLQWVPRWWQSGMFYYNPLANRLFAFLMLLSIPLMLILLVTLGKKRKSYLNLFYIWLIAFLAIVVWFLSAPDFRFAYGFILPVCIIPIYIFTDVFSYKYLQNKKILKTLNLFVVISAILFVALQSVRWAYYQHDITASLSELFFKPQTLDYTKKLKEEKYSEEILFVRQRVNNVDIYSANIETHCYDCPLPCSSDYTGGIEMRGETLQDGFRSRAKAPYRRSY